MSPTYEEMTGKDGVGDDAPVRGPLASDDAYGLPRVSDLGDTLCYLRRHVHDGGWCRPSRNEAVRIVLALQARYSYWLRQSGTEPVERIICRDEDIAD